MILRIKEIISDKNVRVTTLADEVGITRANMSNIVNGKSTPSLETMDKIAKALGVELWELLTKETSKDELTALVSHKGDFYQAKNLLELENIVEEIKKGKE